MNIILMLIPLTLVLVLVAGWGFFWAVETGQFDDLDSAGWDVLVDDAAACTVSAAESDPDAAATVSGRGEPS
ncbi:MAG: cbb3-type cytochrome oxidase assembly protein CcoS [Steroidobacteraceae bacterium]